MNLKKTVERKLEFLWAYFMIFALDTRAALSEKVIEVLVFSGVMTTWVLLFSQMYSDMITGSGYSYGIGEIFLGFTIPALVATIMSWWLIKRIRANR